MSVWAVINGSGVSDRLGFLYVTQRVASLGYKPLYEGKTRSGIAAFRLRSENDAEAFRQKCEQAKVILAHHGDYVRVSAQAAFQSE